MTLAHNLLAFGLSLGLAVGFVAPSQAQAQAVVAPGAPVRPPVPTIKILALGHLTAKGTGEARRAILPAEVRATVNLYLNGKIDQWYSRQDGTGVVFVLNVTDVRQAREMLENLPLGRAGLMDFELVPLGPLNPLRLLTGPGVN